ncbi:hypothetical protein C8R44DRAFT_226662 [Mycena epipterygia]|nr:hypothetical protein C8R44DRAFT_226662 [Mycena epipterygia]
MTAQVYHDTDRLGTRPPALAASAPTGGLSNGIASDFPFKPRTSYTCARRRCESGPRPTPASRNLSPDHPSSSKIVANVALWESTCCELFRRALVPLPRRFPRHTLRSHRTPASWRWCGRIFAGFVWRSPLRILDTKTLVLGVCLLPRPSSDVIVIVPRCRFTGSSASPIFVGTQILIDLRVSIACATSSSPRPT